MGRSSILRNRASQSAAKAANAAIKGDCAAAKNHLKDADRAVKAAARDRRGTYADLDFIAGAYDMGRHVVTTACGVGSLGGVSTKRRAAKRRTQKRKRR